MAQPCTSVSSVKPLVLMEGALQDLRPVSRGLVMAQRPPSTAHTMSFLDRTREIRHRALRSAPGSSGESVLEKNCSAMGMEEPLVRKVPESQGDPRAAFRASDPHGRLAVTGAGFRWAINGTLLPLTESEFEALLARVPKRGNRAAACKEWLKKSCRIQTAGDRSPGATVIRCRSQAVGHGIFTGLTQDLTIIIPCVLCPTSPPKHRVTIAELQRHPRHKITGDLKNISGAFLSFGHDRDRRIESVKLCSILEGCGLPVSEEEFYNPNIPGTTSYPELLQMLGVDSESQGNIGAESAQTALNQNIVNQEKTGQRKPADPWTAQSKDDRFQDLTSDEMQTTFQEKMSAKSSVVLQALQTLDATQNGSVSMKDLKVVLCDLLFPMSDETFLALVCRFGVNATGPVSWSEFLARVWDTAKDGRHAEPARESPVQELPVRSSTTSALPKLKEHVASDRFLHNRRNLLDQNQIHTLAEALGFRDGTAPHSESMANLKDSAAGKTDAAARCVGTSTDPVGFLTAEECFSQMKERIKVFHGDVFTAFRVMDKNCDGVISRQSFRNLHDSLMFVTKETEYSRLLDLLGLRPGATLNYAEFNSLVQAGASTAALPHPATRPNPALPETCDRVLSYLACKARRGWPNMAKVLCRFDRNGQSIILKQDLKRLLYTYAMPLTPKEFDQLWLWYDEGGRGYIREAEFLEKIGVGPRKVGHGPERPSPGECADEGPRGGSARASAQALHTRVALHELRMAMRHSNGDHGPILARQGEGKIEQLLVPAQELGCRGEDAQLGQQLSRMGIHLDDGPLSYTDVTSMIDGGAAAESGRRQETPAVTENAKGPSLENVMFRLRELVTATYEALHKAFSALDESRRGDIQPWAFRRVLDHFCFRLTDQQFDHLMEGPMVDKWDGTVSWKAFLHSFLPNEHEAARARSEDVGKGVRRGACPLPASDILGQIRKVVPSRLHTVAEDVAHLNHTGSNVIPKEDSGAICDRHSMRLTSEQFENLWNRLPVNPLGSLEHREFPRSFGGGATERPRSSGGVAVTGPSTRGITSAAPGLRQRPRSTPSSIRSSKPAEQTTRPCSSRQRSTPPANCERAECSLRSQMHASWREIHRKCREVDREQLGEVSMEQFLAIMEELRLKSTPMEIQQLASDGGVVNGGGAVYYPEFLRHFILTPKAQDKHAFRPRVHVSRTSMRPGVLSGQCVDAMLRMQGPIQQFWRGMRRNFVTLDRNRSGSVSLQDFRKVVSRYGIDLSEEEFFHLSSFFDKNISGQIFYNDFFVYFLKMS